MNANLLMTVGGVAAFVLTIHLVRSRDLRERYAVGWLGVAVILLLCGLFPRAIMRLAESVQLSYPAAVLFIALAAIYFFSFFVTVALTRQYRRSMRVMQEVAILNHQIRVLEAELARSRGTNGHIART